MADRKPPLDVKMATVQKSKDCESFEQIVQRFEQIEQSTPYLDEELPTETQKQYGIVCIPGEAYSLVDKNSKLIEILKRNGPSLRINVDECRLVKERCYIVSNRVIRQCISAEEENKKGCPLSRS